MINSSPQIQARQILDIVYPIGIIVEFASNVNPNDIMQGQQWELYGQGRVTVCKGDGIFATLGDQRGELNHTLTTAEMPAHTHTRGTMNITGTCVPRDTSADTIQANFSGAFYELTEGQKGGTAQDWSKNAIYGYGFDASRSWTGATSSVGSGNAHNNVQPSIVVLRYRRTA